MNLRSDPHDLALLKFGIGQPVPRSEDPKLLRAASASTAQRITHALATTTKNRAMPAPPARESAGPPVP